jgi:hypothetical protein
VPAGVEGVGGDLSGHKHSHRVGPGLWGTAENGAEQKQLKNDASAGAVAVSTKASSPGGWQVHNGRDSICQSKGNCN